MIKTYKCASEPNLRNTMSNLRNLTISCNYNIAVNIENKKSEKERTTQVAEKKRKGNIYTDARRINAKMKWDSICLLEKK